MTCRGAVNCPACERIANNPYAQPMGAEHDNACPEGRKDARGVAIEEGDTVVYGAGVGRSVAMVTGAVDGWTPSGRAWVRVDFRAYGGDSHTPERVHVDPTRMVVVRELA